MSAPDDPGILVIHPEPDSLHARVAEILLAAREPEYLATLPPEVADEPLYSHVNYIDRLTGIPTPAVWHLPPPPPQHHRTPTHTRHGGQRGDKTARKAQKQARKAKEMMCSVS